MPTAQPSSYVWSGESLKASKRETHPKMSSLGETRRALEDDEFDRVGVYVLRGIELTTPNRPECFGTRFH